MSSAAMQRLIVMARCHDINQTLYKLASDLHPVPGEQTIVIIIQTPEVIWLIQSVFTERPE